MLHMEFAPNGSLADLIKLDRQMKSPDWFNELTKARFSLEIAEGMKSLHDQGIIHKDLKPDNILIDSNNHIKICDFSFIPEEGAATLKYMSPELLLGEEGSKESDVYAYGVTLATLFGGGDMITSAKTGAIQGFRPSISYETPELIRQIILKCWSQNPEDRPSFDEIIRKLISEIPDQDVYKIDTMESYEGFSWSNHEGEATKESIKYIYRVGECSENTKSVESMIRRCITVQPNNTLQIVKYCQQGSKFALIIDKKETISFKDFIEQRKKNHIHQERRRKYVRDFISIFELFHKYGFYYGPFSIDRLFFKESKSGTLCFDMFLIPGLDIYLLNSASDKTNDDIQLLQKADVFSFGCFVLTIYNCLILDHFGMISPDSFRNKELKRAGFSSKFMKRILNEDPSKRPSFIEIYQILFSKEYEIVSNYLEKSISRISAYNYAKVAHKSDLQFIRLLGEGTSGKATLFENTKTNEIIVVKEYKDDIASSSAKRQRTEDFLVEFITLRSIDHPNIVKIFGASPSKIGKHGSRIFMEYGALGDLSNHLSESEEDFMVHLLQISSAMKYLHQRGFVHLDLKPQNILIREDKSACVTDFNTAMYVDFSRSLSSIRGTIGYIAPEVIGEDEYSFPADVFSFGVIAAEYFYIKRSNEGMNNQQFLSEQTKEIIQAAIQNNERPALSFIKNEEVRLIVEMCIDPNPENRPTFDIICQSIYDKIVSMFDHSQSLKHLTEFKSSEDQKYEKLQVVDSLNVSDELRINSLNEYSGFDPNKQHGLVRNKASGDVYKYEFYIVENDPDRTEEQIRMFMSIEPECVTQIIKYYRSWNKFVLILEYCDIVKYNDYIKSRERRLPRSRVRQYVVEMLSIFNFFHKHNFTFGHLSLNRIYFRKTQPKSICFDLFDIVGLDRVNPTDSEALNPMNDDMYSVVKFIFETYNSIELLNLENLTQRKLKTKIPPIFYQTIFEIIKSYKLNEIDVTQIIEKLNPTQNKILRLYFNLDIDKHKIIKITKTFKTNDIERLEIVEIDPLSKLFHGRNKETGQEYIIKEFNKFGKEMTYLEFSILNYLDHPNIIKVFGMKDEDSGSSSVYLDYVNGKSLESINDFVDMIKYMIQIASAMKYIHQNGFIFNNIRSDSILLGKGGNAILTDFGSIVPRNYKNARISGEQKFMPPEQVEGRIYTYPVDIYAFGVMISEFYQKDSCLIIKSSIENDISPDLEFIKDNRLRKLVELCVDEDPMTRPSFKFICNYLYNKFFNGNEKMEKLTHLPSMKKERLKYIEKMSSRMNIEAIREYSKYLIFNDMFSTSMKIIMSGVKAKDSSMMNTIAVLHRTKLIPKTVDSIEQMFEDALENDYAKINYCILQLLKPINECDIRKVIKLLESAQNIRYSFYILGLVYEQRDIEGMNYKERIRKAIDCFREGSNEEDGSSLFKFAYYVGIDPSFDDERKQGSFLFYLKRSAFARNKFGCLKYSELLSGNKKQFYHDLGNELPGGEMKLVWEYDDHFEEEISTCFTGIIMNDRESKTRFEFIKKNINQPLYVK